MKRKCLSVALVVVLILMFSTVGIVSAESATTEFAALPAGTYTYVDTSPTAQAGSNEGQVQFIYSQNELVWAFGSQTVETGSAILTGDELQFFIGLYLSDRPLYDWLASDSRDTEGYEGNVSDNFLITFTDSGKISTLRVDNGITNVIAILSSNITNDTLIVSGATRGQPNLLQSSITLFGSTNALWLTDRGNVVLNELSIGHNEDGIGLISDKIGGDTFIVNTVNVDGIIHWYSRYANLQPVQAGEEATLSTNGQDMILSGCSVGRMGRTLNFTAGEGGGDIIIGETVSTDYGRADPLPDPSTGTLTLSTSGSIDAGEGDVIIGTNTERVVKIDVIGSIHGTNITIKPTDNGTVTDLAQSIGNITATGNVDILIGKVNESNDATQVFGSITADGNVTLVAGDINGTIGDVSASGNVTMQVASAIAVGEVTGTTVEKDVGEVSADNQISAVPISSSVLVDGQTIVFDAYTVNGNNYFKLRDIAYALSNTEKVFDMDWYGTVGAIATLTSGRSYAETGIELSTSAGTETQTAVPVSISTYLDGKMINVGTYKIGDDIYFKLRDLGSAIDFGVTWDSSSNAVIIDSSTGYVSE
ncbi:MAG: hypothetical protein LUH51_09025 [Firmicutes bacterium]|nr:hypothetical protein [Bacillota bacterium]